MSKIDNIAAILNKSVVFLTEPFTSNVFLGNSEAYKLYYLLYLERNIIYLSTTYVKFILVAYSVLLKIEGKANMSEQRLPNVWRMKISTTQIRKAYREM